ncbi:uncharacterized protein LOC120159514 [Hibiscus syriacus]|uniref:uncharacterized protein LOC120159514 n=1 Tax=Hibiscus syriacus TaxID=106335 RepID=UPI001923CAE3|nr:uncharacterized protein LOC120159514 [Hibiscus syriacus]
MDIVGTKEAKEAVPGKHHRVLRILMQVVGKKRHRVLAYRFHQVKRMPCAYIPWTTSMALPALTRWSEWIHCGPDWTIAFSQDAESASLPQHDVPQPMQGYADGSIMQPNDLPHLGTDGFNQMFMLGSQTQGNSDGSMQPNDLPSHPHFACSDNNDQSTPTPRLPHHAEQHLVQNQGCSATYYSNIKYLTTSSDGSDYALKFLY